MSKQLLSETTRRPRGAVERLLAVRSTPLSRRSTVWALLFLMLVRGACLPPPAVASGPGGKPAGVPQIVETFNVYGPRRFERAAGVPATVTESFVLPADAVAPFRGLCFKNRY